MSTDSNDVKECSFDKPKRTCDFTCFACTFMHGLKDNGKGGLWATTGVPKKYKANRLENLPIQDDNPQAYETVRRYVSNILETVQEKNIGLYLFSNPTQSNPYGTGTGKTTSATTILNHYVIERARAYFKGDQDMTDNPALFVKATELQNTFNKQFRGTREQQEQASVRYYKLKERLKRTELIVLDDVATRGSRISEAFEEELYEIIDYRSSMVDNGAIIFTSNVPYTELGELVGERIASRIAGLTINVPFTGDDKRLTGGFGK